MEQGLDRQGVIGRLQGDYEVQIDKANLITDIAYLQLPFLAKANDPKLISVYVEFHFVHHVVYIVLFLQVYCQVAR